MSMFEQKGNALIARYNGEIVQVEPWGENSLRVRAVKMGSILDTDYALLPPAPSTPVIHVEENGATIQNGKLRAVLTQNEGGLCEIAYENQHGKELFRELNWHGALNLYARRFKPILGGDYELTASFLSDPDEKLYGMGQYQQAVMNIKNCTFELAHRNSQASVPFVLSSRGYGFLWHNPAIGRASFCRNRTEWVAQSTKQLDYWVTAGDTPAEIEEAYAKATGTVPMMPEYGLGFWQCKLRYWNQEQVLQVAREYKRRGLPLDVIVIDFFHWPRMGDFRFDEKFFPDPKAMCQELKELGVALMVSIWPQIDLRSENFQEMKEKGLLIQAEYGVKVSMQFGGDSLFLDATNPETRDFVWKKCKQNYYDNGVSLFWLDEAEPEYGVYEFDNYRYKIGSNVQIGNVYPQMYSRLFYDGMKQEGQEKIVNLVRCAWAGSQRYGALVWSGDVHSTFEDFRSQLCAGLHMGICGIPWWTTDIGGFSGGDSTSPAFRELLVRWFQYGTFCPVMRLHGDRLPDTMINGSDGLQNCHTGSDNEVWSFGDDVYEILRRYMMLRETMRDYTRSLMQEAHEKGSPVMRTLFYEFPDDPACWEAEESYLFGPDVLVAPVMYEGATSRSVYLPKGARWTDLHTGREFEGGQTITADAPLAVIPVFLRDGRHKEWVGQI